MGGTSTELSLLASGKDGREGASYEVLCAHLEDSLHRPQLNILCELASEVPIMYFLKLFGFFVPMMWHSKALVNSKCGIKWYL